MLEFLALMEARDGSGDLAFSALPDAPTYPDPVKPGSSRVRRRLRQVLVRALRWMLDRVEPRVASSLPVAVDTSEADSR